MTDNFNTDNLATAANGRAPADTFEAKLLADIANIDQQLEDAYYAASFTGNPADPDWLHKALEARRHRANKLRDLGVDPGRPPMVDPGERPGTDAGEVARLTREVERLTAEVERLTEENLRLGTENERLTDELEAWAE